MIERVYFPIHGNQRGGTGYTCYGGFGYGRGYGDAVTLAPDRPTDLFAQSLSTQVDTAVTESDGDQWLARTPAGKTMHAPEVLPAWTQPATNALTTMTEAAEEVAKTGKLDLKKVPWWAWAIGAWFLLGRR